MPYPLVNSIGERNLWKGGAPFCLSRIVPPMKKDIQHEDAFTQFMRRLLAVPHSEIKAKLDAEKAAKKAAKDSASRVSGVPSKPA